MAWKTHRPPPCSGLRLSYSLERSEKMINWHARSCSVRRGTIFAVPRRSAMKPLVTDELWARIEPLLPPAPRRRVRFPGRKPLDYRKILTGILFVLKTGIAWDDLPAELGSGCGKAGRHYLLAWH